MDSNKIAEKIINHLAGIKFYNSPALIYLVRYIPSIRERLVKEIAKIIDKEIKNV